MPPNAPAANNRPRKTLKNVRNTWLEKGKRHLVKQFRINSKTNERGSLYRNVAGISAATMEGLRNSRNPMQRNFMGKGFAAYTNRPLTLKGKLSKNDKNAIRYRQFNTSVLTPQLRGQTRLNETEAKVAANVYAAAAPDYNYQEMVNGVYARTNLSPQQKDTIVSDLYQLYGPNNNNNTNTNTSNNSSVENGAASPTGAVLNNDVPSPENIVQMPTTRKANSKRRSLPAGW